MGGKQGIIVAVLVVVILVAIGLTVKSRYGAAEAPEAVMGEKATYICGKCGAETTLTLKEWQGLSQDKTTGYRKCPKCGEMALGALMICPQCEARIVGPPLTAMEVPDDPTAPMKEPYYKCPKCGKNALVERLYR